MSRADGLRGLARAAIRPQVLTEVEVEVPGIGESMRWVGGRRPMAPRLRLSVNKKKFSV